MRSRWALAPAREVIGQFPASCARVAKTEVPCAGGGIDRGHSSRVLGTSRAFAIFAMAFACGAGNGHTTSGGTHRCVKRLTVEQPKQRPQRSPITLSNRTVNRP